MKRCLNHSEVCQPVRLSFLCALRLSNLMFIAIVLLVLRGETSEEQCATPSKTDHVRLCSWSLTLTTGFAGLWCQREHIQRKGVSFLSIPCTPSPSVSPSLSWALHYNTMKYLKSIHGLIIHHAITYQQLSPAFSISWFSQLCFFILCLNSLLHSIPVITERL